ncbi:hypothetical protein E2C01_099296 [Portunus trituberculatus]|uniref:Uncharacterized protein n=1 Tax=Portunus trituberculatus TaxID=210409 RepID=A0A5B7KAG4_PORTR|nr:hypothetical protein [Portunus trituberculatus]
MQLRLRKINNTPNLNKIQQNIAPKLSKTFPYYLTRSYTNSHASRNSLFLRCELRKISRWLLVCGWQQNGWERPTKGHERDAKSKYRLLTKKACRLKPWKFQIFTDSTKYCQTKDSHPLPCSYSRLRQEPVTCA